MRKTESENQFLTSIKGRNSVVIGQKLPICNPRTLLPNIDSHTKFEENWLRNAPSREWTDGRTYRRTDRQMDRQTDGRTDTRTHFFNGGYNIIPRTF